MGGAGQPCSTFHGAGNLGKISFAFGKNKIQAIECRKPKKNYVYSV